MLSVAFLLSFIIAAITAPLVIKFYRSKNWIDDPLQKKHVKVLHDKAVPRGGGIVIFSAIFLTTFFLTQLNMQFLIILLGAGVLMILGVFDDVLDLNPYIRFGAGIGVGVLIVLAGIDIQYITHPFESGVLFINQPIFHIGDRTISMKLPFLSGVLTILWILWNMNIVNWSKGVDGQLPGVVAIAAFFIGILSLRFSSDPNQSNVILLSFLVSGAYAGLLLWNAYPQKIMPGYGAGSLGGYFLALLAILSGAKLATALLVLALPTADAAFTILRRLLNKKSPFWGDRGHLHHKLIDVLGWSKRQTAFFYWGVTAMMGIIALQLKPEQKVFTILVVTALVFGFLIWAKLFISFSKPPAQDNG